MVQKTHDCKPLLPDMLERVEKRSEKRGLFRRLHEYSVYFYVRETVIWTCPRCLSVWRWSLFFVTQGQRAPQSQDDWWCESRKTFWIPLDKASRSNYNKT